MCKKEENETSFCRQVFTFMLHGSLSFQRSPPSYCLPFVKSLITLGFDRQLGSNHATMASHGVQDWNSDNQKVFRVKQAFLYTNESHTHPPPCHPASKTTGKDG